ncbi:MAG: hypothetical protein ACFFAN_11655 [Promethearchaeota archaeon]
MVNFLLLIESIVNYTKEDIDKGETPSEIYKICSCIRETFCLSYAIRKDNNLFLYFHKNGVLIKFVGHELKYLGSDERSQALLLKKALDKIKQINSLEIENWLKSTPGIYMRKVLNNISFFNYLNSLESFKPIYIIDNKDARILELHSIIKKFNSLNNLLEYFFVIPTYNLATKDSKFFQLFKELKDIRFFTLSKIEKLEDKILYINFQSDLLRNRD